MKTFKKLKNVFNFYKKSTKQVNYYNTAHISIMNKVIYQSSFILVKKFSFFRLQK